MDGAKGETGPMGIQFVGKMGEKGPKGEKGDPYSPVGFFTYNRTCVPSSVIPGRPVSFPSRIIYLLLRADEGKPEPQDPREKWATISMEQLAKKGRRDRRVSLGGKPCL